MRFIASALVVRRLRGTGLSGCATDYHYSQISGANTTSPNRHLLDLDPARRRPQHDPAPDAGRPGRRMILVQGRPTASASRAAARDRARREAVHPLLPRRRQDDRLSSDFDVQVDYEEPVGGCTPPKVS
jgi:hypothetical protein